MLQLDEITSLTEFQRNTKDHIRRLKRTGRPEVLTVNGQAEVVVQSASGYQDLLAALDRAQAIAGIKMGIEAAKRGDEIPVEEMLAEIRKTLGLGDKKK